MTGVRSQPIGLQSPPREFSIEPESAADPGGVTRPPHKQAENANSRAISRPAVRVNPCVTGIPYPVNQLPDQDSNLEQTG